MTLQELLNQLHDLVAEDTERLKFIVYCSVECMGCGGEESDELVAVVVKEKEQVNLIGSRE